MGSIDRRGKALPDGMTGAPSAREAKAWATDGGDFVEIELKLTGKPSDLSAAFHRLTGREPTPSKLVSTYYDTPDGRLWRRGFTLRLRRKGAAYELTLKRAGADGWKHGEWTAIVEEPRADLGLLPPGAPRNDVGVVPPEALEPRFVSDIERARATLDQRGASIELSLDTGRIVAGDRELPAAELEFELLGGSALVLLKRLRALLREYPLAVSTHSKAACGVALATDAPPAYSKAVKPHFEASDTIDRALRRLMSTTAAQILGNLAAAADGRDPEGVHQLRVGLRRLRTVLALFQAGLTPSVAALRGEAKRALKRLGRARDLDVFLLEALPPVVAGNPDMKGLKRLMKTAMAQRNDAYRDVRRLVSDRRFNVFLVDLLILAEGGGTAVRECDVPIGPMAEALLRKRHKKVRKLGKRFGDLSPKQRHKVRIAIKKLRYACDYFRVLYPPKASRAYLKRLADLQDDLGRLNDAREAERMADRLADREADTAEAALIKGWYRRRSRSDIPEVVKAWRQFTKARPFWWT